MNKLPPVFAGGRIISDTVRCSFDALNSGYTRTGSCEKRIKTVTKKCK
jgi:hypothetical protein